MSTSILPTIQTQLNYYGYTFCMILGNIGNIFIVILLTRQRPNPCSIFLIYSTIINTIYLTFVCFVQLFPFYYLDETIRAFILCKLRAYTPAVLGLITKTMVTLACIDRFLITDQRATFRGLITLKRAKFLILFFSIFWLVCCSHMVIMTTIVNRQCGTFGIYGKIYPVFIMICVGLLPPIISGLFGCLTYRNIRQRHVRIQPIENNRNIDIRRKDRALLTIVMAEVFVYIITTSPYPFILLEIMISQYIIPNKSIQHIQIENFILSIAFFLLFINFAVPFYIYLISSKSFQEDFKNLIRNFYRKLTTQPNIPVHHGTIHQTAI